MKNLTLLDRWQGGDAMVWEYSVSFSNLIIRIERPGQLGNLQIGFGSTTHICCPTRWENCFFEVTELPEGYILRDTIGGVEIHAGEIDFAENCEPIYVGRRR